jgi:hypothetical protein
MARRHTFVVAALLALSAVAGSLGLARTLDLGAASAGANDAQVAAQERRLSAFEASLHRQLAGKPASSTGPRLAPSRAQRIRYVRPSPIVFSSTSSGHEDEADEDEHEGGGEAFEHEGGDDD